MKIIETNNDNPEYPSEAFLNIPPIPEKAAHIISEALNDAFPANFSRYWKVVPNDYILKQYYES